MNRMTVVYRRLLFLILPFFIVFSIFKLAPPPSTTFINSVSTEISPDILFDQLTTSPLTSTIVTSTPKTCVPYNTSDIRPFFERERPQSNLPQPISNSSRKSLQYRLRSFRLAAVSCARNVEQHIDKLRKYVEPIVDLFHPSSRIIIFESDSTDNTVAKFKQWSRAEVHTYGNLSTTLRHRTERLGYCRSELLRKARELQADYMFVFDADLFAANISSFLTNFEYDINDWSVMTATLRSVYYDIWALRTLSDTVLNYDVLHKVRAMQFMNGYCLNSLENNIVYNHFKPFPVQLGLYEVRSGFGGAAIYKMNATEGCDYVGEGYSCEHVSFHLCMRETNKAKIFINPKFTNEEGYRSL